MILNFSVNNFRSFREEQKLSMVASNRFADHANHLRTIPDDENKLLPVAVIYGANGAGKSNLVNALSFLERLVLRGTEDKKPTGRRPFLLDTTSAKEPTELTIQFLEDGRVYEFGCRVSDKLIDAEWLCLLRDGKETIVYERVTNSDGEVTIEAGLVLKDDTWGDHSKPLALSRVGALPNQLFLHVVGKSLRERDQGPVMAGAIRWFRERLTIIKPEDSFGDLAGLVAQNTAFATFAGEFLKRVATGVDRLRVDTAEVEEKMLLGLADGMKQIVADLPPGETTVIVAPDGSQFIVEKGEGTKVRLRTVQSEHVTAEGTRVTLPFSEESDGTQRVTHLLPALHAAGDALGVYVIDEIDRSLHPLLAKGFVRSFLDTCASKGGQLIFTTHETAFLDTELLRRDEIWFTDKKRAEGNTELYSLADYKVRTDLKIDKAYLQGRFDGIPPVESALPEWVDSIIEELKPKVSTKPEAVS
jgi:AAA15 family ATPase/GTPase